MLIKKQRIICRLTSGIAVTRFQVAHILDLSDVQRAAREIDEILSNYDVKILVIDFTGVKQVTSSLLSKLTVFQKVMKGDGGELRVCGMTGNVREAFRICKLHKLIPTFKTEGDALKE